MHDDLLEFARNTGKHPSGLFLEDVWKLPDHEIESRHDIIQWMFPTMTPSQAQPQSPYIHEEMLRTYQEDIVVRMNLITSTERYIQFLRDNTSIWAKQYDHNHLRITRVIESIRLLIGREQAKSFYSLVCTMNAVQGYPVNIQSTEYWKEALNAPNP